MFFLAPALLAQNADSGIPTRADQIQGQRLEKIAEIRPERPMKEERYFTRIMRLYEKSPVKAQVGNLGPGAGFALGSVFEWNNRNDSFGYRLWGGASVHRFYVVGTGIEFRDLADSGINFALAGSHRDLPQLDYYGPGPDSSVNNRTDYRKEETLFDFRVTTDPYHHVTPACGLGELLLNVGPGTSGSLPSTESVFGPAQAPGIDVQSNYLLPGCSVGFI